jgi:hypothetical protein
MRRSWLHGVVDVSKRYLIAVAAHNLGRILRKLFGIGKPKALQGQSGLAALAQFLRHTSWNGLRMLWLVLRHLRQERGRPTPAS